MSRRDPKPKGGPGVDRPEPRATEDESLRLDHQLCFALHAASRLVVRAYRPLLEPLGLTYPQYLAMLVLWEAEPEPVSVHALGERLLLDSGTLTPMLKRLEAEGLVSRKRSSADERVVEIALTPHGRQLRERAAGIPQKLLACTPLPVDELVELKRRAESLTAALRR